MTANELIDKLESVSIRLLGKETEQAGRAIILYRESAIMLQQQAKEIAMLKQIIDANNLQSDIGQFVKPIDEPVAWISVLALDHIGQKFTDVRISLTKTDVADIPLYTHPAKTLTDETLVNFKPVWQEKPELTLTAEKIRTVIDEHWEKTSNVNLFDFARAILKKAQEK